MARLLSWSTTIGASRLAVVSFTPAEVNFLFPGPFARRELLLYKVVKSACGATLMSLFLSVVMLRYATLWAACFAGVLLAMLFLQFASMAVALAGQVKDGSFRPRVESFGLAGGVLRYETNPALAGRIPPALAGWVKAAADSIIAGTLKVVN